MAQLDHSSKIIARVSGRALARIAGYSCRKWKPSESTVQVTTERLADRVFEAAQGNERFIVYFEFVFKWDASVPWSILVKSALLAERDRLPVASLIFILQPKGYSPQNGTFRLSIGDRLSQQVCFVENPLWQIKPEPWWETEPGLMALYPLCRHSEEPAQSVLHAASRIEENEKDRAVRADLLTSLGILGRLAYPKIDVLSLIGREKMKESLAYQEILEEGREEGRERGLKEGLEEGLASYRKTLLSVVKCRFGKAGEMLGKRAIKSARGLDELGALTTLAATCSNLDELKAAMK
jgi:hypothetical protein